MQKIILAETYKMKLKVVYKADNILVVRVKDGACYIMSKHPKENGWRPIYLDSQIFSKIKNIVIEETDETYG